MTYKGIVVGTHLDGQMLELRWPHLSVTEQPREASPLSAKVVLQGALDAGKFAVFEYFWRRPFPGSGDSCGYWLREGSAELEAYDAALVWGDRFNEACLRTQDEEETT